MTKYSKIKKSSFAILALSLILVAVLAIGGTYAYFSDKVESGTASVTTGTLTLTDTLTLSVNEESLVPNQSAPITLSQMALGGNTLSCVRFSVSEITLSGGSSASLTADQKKLLTLDVVVDADTADTTYGWVKGSDGAYYYDNYVTELDIDAGLTVSVKLDATAGNEWQGITATFKITFEAVQAEYNGELGATPTFNLTAAEALPWTQVVANPVVNG